MKNYFCALFILLAFSGFTQEISYYNIYGTQTNPYSGRYQLVTMDTLKDAKTLSDINGKYRPNWVAEYYSVEITTSCAGVVKKAVSKNDVLTEEQLNVLKAATADCSIEVVVDYLPNNTLKHNPPRQLSFVLTPMPIFEAKYPGGPQALKTYLRENIMDKIPAGKTEQINLAKVQFTINELGQVADAQMVQTTTATNLDKLMLEALCDMPKWTPAKNAQGTIITQEFEFRMGTDLLRCDYQY